MNPAAAFLSHLDSPEVLAQRYSNALAAAGSSRGKAAVELINVVMRLCGAEGDVVSSGSALVDVDVGLVVDNVADALTGSSASQYLLALEEPACDPASGMEGFFTAVDQEFPPAPARAPGAGLVAKDRKAVEASAALRRRLATFWQALVYGADHEVLFGEGGIADFLPELFVRVSR